MTYPGRIKVVAVALLTVAAISGCAETEREAATGKGTIRGINSIVTSPELLFKIEERNLGGTAYKGVAGFSEYDDLTYNFNFDLFLPGEAQATRLATQFLDVVIDTEYTIVIAGTIANPTLISWEAAERDWDPAETVFEADFVHLSPTTAEADVYFAATGTVPVLGEAIGSLNYGERIPYREFPDGNFELIVTAKDDPNNFLFQSRVLASTPADRVTFAIFDPDPTITAIVAVNLINSNGASTTLFDPRFPGNVRLLHAAEGTGRVDGYLNSDFNNTIFPDIGFGELSAYRDIDSALIPLTLTDVGNSGAPVHEEQVTIPPNSRHTIIFGGAPGTLSFTELTDDARPLETFPVVRFTNMSVNTDFLNTTPRFSGMPSLISTGFFGPDEGTHEITVTLRNEITPISTPITIEVVNGDIADIVILDTTDPARVDVVIFDSTLP
jgi:hypothetical protein